MDMSKDSHIFEKAAFGYRTDEVDRYVEDMNRKIAALEAEKADMQAKMKILAETVNGYMAEESNLKDALLEAQRIKNSIEAEARARADQMVGDAEARSQQLMQEAKAHATRLLAEAKAHAEKMIADARQQADESVRSVRNQVENEQRVLSRMQREVSTFKSTLISSYRSHLNLITSLPDEERKKTVVSQPVSEPVMTEPQPVPAVEPAAEPVVPEAPVQPEPPQVVTVEQPVPQAEPQEAPEVQETVDTVSFDQAAFAEKFGELRFTRSDGTPG